MVDEDHTKQDVLVVGKVVTAAQRDEYWLGNKSIP